MQKKNEKNQSVTTLSLHKNMYGDEVPWNTSGDTPSITASEEKSSEIVDVTLGFECVCSRIIHREYSAILKMCENTNMKSTHLLLLPLSDLPRTAISMSRK